MNKKLFIFAAALAVLVSCTKVGGPETAPSEEGSAIGFSAYAGGTVTKGVTHELVDVIDPSKGIGVFAFYQPSSSGRFSTKKYGIPNFMYNVQVKPDKAGTPTSWSYSPIKYWPNNDGDMVSFFAYAPYDASASWEDLGFRTDVNGSRLSLSLPVYDEKESMQDYMYAAPTLNMTKPTVSTVVSFNFQHVMSKVALNIGAVVDQASTAGPQKWTDPLTRIIVTSVEIDGIATSYDCTCPITAGGTLGTASWTANGDQDLVLSGRNGDFQNDTISTKYYGSLVAGTWRPLLSDETVGGASKPGYLFIAPQDLTKAKLTVTYKVITDDPTYTYNGSVVTNKIEKPLGVNFESGKAYTLNLLIGMTSVKFSATVTDWDESTPSIQITAWGSGSTPVGPDDPGDDPSDGHYREGGTDYGEGITINGVTWAPVNCGIGASNAYPYGLMYQFGRSEGQPYDGETGAPTGSDLVYGQTATPATGKFYYGYDDWYSGTAFTAWPMTSSSNGIGNPCPTGWRVPTEAEFYSLIGLASGGGKSDIEMLNFVDNNGVRGHWFNGTINPDSTSVGKTDYVGVFIPVAGRRYVSGSSVSCDSRGEKGHYSGYYWTSTIGLDSSSNLCPVRFRFNEADAGVGCGESLSCGLSVRCVAE